MASSEIRFPNGSILASIPDERSECLLNGGAWGEIWAFKYLSNLLGMEGGEVIETRRTIFGPLTLYVLGRRYKDISLAVDGQLILNCEASNFQQDQVHTQVYEGDFKLGWVRQFRWFESFLAWIRRRLGLPLPKVSGETFIRGATVRLTYPPAADADISVTMSGDMSEPVIPGTQPHVRMTWSSKAPDAGQVNEYTYLLNDAILTLNWMS